MPSLPLGSIDGRTASCVACYRRLWPAHTVEQRRAWHVIIAFGQHTQSNDVRRFIPSSPLDGKHGLTTSGVACNHRLWAAQTVERRRAWHAIIALGQHRRSDGVGCGIPSSPLDSTHSQTTSGVACHHRLWGAHRIERCWALHAIIAFGQHTRSDDVGHGMTSPHLDSTHGRQHRACHDIAALGQHRRSATSGVA